jgi:hypothetical protein
LGKEIKLDAKKVPVYKKKEEGTKKKKQPLVLKDDLLKGPGHEMDIFHEGLLN